MQKNMSRRDFVKMAGIIGGSIFIAPSLFNSALAAPYANIQGLFSTHKLNNGVEIPLFGFEACTHSFSSAEQSGAQITLEALQIGYKHIEIYQTEREVGEAFILSQIPRQDVFLSLKLPKNITSENELIESFNESLAKLKVNYVDLLLIELPESVNVRVSWLELASNIWNAMEKLYAQKRTRSIGVINLDIAKMHDFVMECKVRPMVNKLAISPFNFNQRLLDVSYHNKMLVSAYASLGNFEDIMHEPLLVRVAKKHNKTVSQVLLRWGLQKNLIVLPTASNSQQLQEYAQIFDFTLDARDMSTIARLKKSK